jgi:hypothetical protein
VIGVECPIEIRGVDVVTPPVADFLFDLAPHEIEPALIEPGATLVRAAHPDEHRCRVRGGAEALLALAQRRFGVHASGDVADEGAEHQLFAKADGRDGQLHRELVAVAVQRHQLDALVQQAGDARVDVATHAVAMFLAPPLWDDELGELATHDFGAAIAEHPLRLRVPAGDHALVVDADHTVQRGLDDELVSFLRNAQRTLGGATQDVGALAARGIDPNETDEHDHARQRENRYGGFESEDAAALDLDREGAGEQRHDDGGRKQAPRQATTDTVAGEQPRDADLRAQRDRAGAEQQDQHRGVHRHVREREQRLAAEHIP